MQKSPPYAMMFLDKIEKMNHRLFHDALLNGHMTIETIEIDLISLSLPYLLYPKLRIIFPFCKESSPSFSAV